MPSASGSSTQSKYNQMNEQEKLIAADLLLKIIEAINNSDRCIAIDNYKQFVEAVKTRVEAERVPNYVYWTHPSSTTDFSNKPTFE
jgi:hypothetical protein